MSLDTRGFMDGALRGFDLMERRYDRQDRKEDRQRSLRQADEDRAENKRRYTDSVERQGRLDSTNEERYQAAQVKDEHRYKDQLARQNRIEKRSAAADKSRIEYNNTRTSQLKRQQFLSDNSVLLDAGWQKFQKTGELDAIFDDPNVKNGAYDVRRYTPQLLTSFKNIETNMPKVLSGEMSADSLVDDLDAIYRPNLNASVGSKDASGKVIASTKLARVTQQADIDPTREGEQPGLVLGMEVFYEDGSSGGIRPVTKNRSTDKNDGVMVIPLESAMKDLTGQMNMARKASSSKYYNKLFKPQDSKTSREFEKEYRKAVNDVYSNSEKTKAKLLESAGGMMTPELKQQIESLDEQVKTRLGQVDALYNKQGNNDSNAQISASQPAYKAWATDTQKLAFIDALAKRGEDLSKATPEVLDAAYTSLINNKKQEQFATDAESLRMRYYQAVQ
ncbi:hypothetical protein [Photobacterium phosphoreum]|jgi:hypothetical protein|uniref:hypothetical protein n=1 Tax=Photobacterium phosphoreum TaxID=659 RepID=UPI0007F92DBC|nr:hypothetical protein [Photobacterium phosphoreum]OBU37930.1 hypothetical protein AYY24_01395 [Photobacterium phosphoreum]PSW38925.1 hypothetical protein CTM87_01140 [Photobacterium phosphoreum]